MIEVKTFKADGKAGDPVKVEEEWFGGTVRAQVLRDAILMYEARQRVGTAHVKGRAEVRGSGRKLWRQKHTGHARVGDGKVSHWRGGGVAFGIAERDFGYKMPRKALKRALDSALLAKLQDNEVLVADCKVDEPKTKIVAGYLHDIGVEKGEAALYVLATEDGDFHRAARNIDGLKVVTLAQLNAYDVVRPRRVIFGKEAFDKLVEQRR